MTPAPSDPRAFWPHPMGPPALDSQALSQAQADTLATPRLRYDPFSRLMFLTVNVLYGRGRSLEKFLVLEQLARIPYQAWERLAQRAIAHSRGRYRVGRRIMERVVEARAQQDNEQFHLLILEELIMEQRSTPLGRLRYRILPRVIASPWHVFTWLLHVVRPTWSYRLNANFEDHAEHEYMAYVAEHPEFDRRQVHSVMADDYGRFASLGDLLRQIGHDERVHKLESLAGHDAARKNQTSAGVDSSARRAA